jgi:DNA invertase Pin-like site-specific DNA recombinase
MGWAIDRLGRSLSDLLDTIQHLEACGVDLYLTSRPSTRRPRWATSFFS